MKRYPHYWHPLRGKYCPSRIAVLDCSAAGATAGIRSQPRTGGVCAWTLETAELRHGERTGGCAFSGETGEQCLACLSSLCSSKGTTWILCDHAFDTLAGIGFWAALAAGHIRLAGRDWTVDRGLGASGEDTADGLCCIEDPPTLILAHMGERPGKLLILDSRNYGIESQSWPRDVQSTASATLQGLLSIVRTLRQDTPVSLRGTAASQAVQILRTRHDCLRLHCHTQPDATALERASYYGGRVQAYRTGVIPGPVYHVDVRSMYPSIGLELPVPVSLRGYYGDAESARRVVESDPEACCAHVRVWCDEPRLPVRRQGEIEYPHGELDTYLAGPELVSAVGAGMVRHVYAAARYNCAPVLAGFYQWQLISVERARARGEAILVQWLKRVGNGLVGKFGEPGRRWVACPARTEMGPFDEWTGPGPDGRNTRYRNVGWHTQRLERHGESYWSIPSIAAWITSAARVRLWDYITCAGRANVWYVDTDGMLINQAGFDRLLRSGHIRDGETGHLRLVGCYRQATIFGVRHYQLGYTIKCSGVRNGAIQEGETREDYFRRTGESAETPLGRLRRMRDEQGKA